MEIIVSLKVVVEPEAQQDPRNLDGVRLPEVQRDELFDAAQEYLRCRAEELRWKAKVFGGEDNRTTREAYYQSTAASKPARERLAKALKRAGAQAVRVGDKVVARVDRGGDLDSLRKKPKEPEFLTFDSGSLRGV